MPKCQFCPKEFPTDGGLHVHQALIHKHYTHGTMGGYRRHRRNKEKPCEQCAQAKRDNENYRGDSAAYAKLYLKAMRILRERHKKEFQGILAKLKSEQLDRILSETLMRLESNEHHP